MNTDTIYNPEKLNVPLPEGYRYATKAEISARSDFPPSGSMCYMAWLKQWKEPVITREGWKYRSWIVPTNWTCPETDKEKIVRLEKLVKQLEQENEDLRSELSDIEDDK